MTKNPKLERAIKDLHEALDAHDEMNGPTYCDCEEHRAARKRVIDAARKLRELLETTAAAVR